jgi:AcrR family transcriptional regulator
MPPPRQVVRVRTGGATAGTSPRSKRPEILTAASAYFGEHGYEDTKWADVAAAVGIGSTALYHYFESKLHCLYVIMADTLERFRSDFDRITGEQEDFLEALVAVMRSGYELTDNDVLRLRLLVAEQGLVGIHRSSPREEEARQLARALTRRLEFAWGTFLTRGMQQGIVPEADPRLLTRAVLGLYNSVWHWYRPRGPLSLAQVADFYLRRQVAVLGLAPEVLDGVRPTPRSPTPLRAKRPRSGSRPETESTARKKR